MTVCRRVYYSGRVQGVGFRATAHALARRHAIAGFVHNLPDGRVEIVAEGEADVVERFLAAVDRTMDGYVADKSTADEPPQGYTGFDITR
jgi:acylphosphatase